MTLCAGAAWHFCPNTPRKQKVLRPPLKSVMFDPKVSCLLFHASQSFRQNSSFAYFCSFLCPFAGFLRPFCVQFCPKILPQERTKDSVEPVLPEISKPARNFHFCPRGLLKGKIYHNLSTCHVFLPDLEKWATGKTNTLFWSNEGAGYHYNLRYMIIYDYHHHYMIILILLALRYIPLALEALVMPGSSQWSRRSSRRSRRSAGAVRGTRRPQRCARAGRGASARAPRAPQGPRK